MKCPHCGSEQSASSTFCGACGKHLTPHSHAKNEERTTTPPSPRRKQIIVAICILLVLLALIAGKSVHKNLKINRLDRQMNRAVEDGSYAEALNNARTLYDLTGDEKYLESAKEIKTVSEMKKDLNRAESALEDGDFSFALQILKDYRDRRDLLPDKYDDLKKDFYSGLERQASKYRSAGSKDQMVALVDSLLAMDGGNERLLAILAEAKASTGAPAQSVDAPPKPKTEPKPNQRQVSSNGSKLSKVASNLLGKDITSTALHTNVRSEPTINAPVVYALEKGSTVHVYRTVIEGNIIWLDIGDGWTSHKNFNGDLTY